MRNLSLTNRLLDITFRPLLRGGMAHPFQECFDGEERHDASYDKRWHHTLGLKPCTDFCFRVQLPKRNRDAECDHEDNEQEVANWR